MRIVVTGGAGFIGSNFVELSVSRHPEHTFINVDKLTYAANLRSLESVSGAKNYVFERVDITDADAVDAVFEKHEPDMVVHFAAESHVDRSIASPRDFIRTNVEGTFNLLDASRRHFPKSGALFHHVSTDEVYGSLGETGKFVETTPYDPSSPYSSSKAASDHLVNAWHRTYGLPVKITNCSNNYGPRQFPEKLVPLMILHCLEGKPLPIYGKGANVRDWLFVTDHCEAIWAVIERGNMGETYNVGGNCERRNIDVVDAICNAVAEATRRDPAPLLALKTFVADRPGHDQRYAIDATKVSEHTGWSPRETFESGLQKTVRWYLENMSWVDSVRSGDYRAWMEQNYGKRS